MIAMNKSSIFVYLAVASCLSLGWGVEGKKGFGPGQQDWGFAEVRPGAKMFWWFYEAMEPTTSDTPLLIWLQGGPGASSTGYGNFMEIGPLDENLNERSNSWAKYYHVLFIDNPVGTGFSSVDSPSLLTRDNNQIAKDLVKCLDSVLSQLPESYRSTPIYIMSESYGGKMTAEFGLELYKSIESGEVKANLKGVGLGDSWISPIDSVLTWAPYLHQLGIVDIRGRDKIMASANRTLKAITEGRWSDATDEWSRTESVVMQVTDGVDFYNVLTKIGYSFDGNQVKNLKQMLPILPGVLPKTIDQRAESLDQIMNVKVKEALGLPRDADWSESSGTVFGALSGDFMKPVTNIVERLLNETDIEVCVYTGQLDLIVDTPGTIDWVERLNWPGKKQWISAARESLVPSNTGIIEGYAKKSGKFSVYWVNRAGHMVPADNPDAMLTILKELTNAN